MAYKINSVNGKGVNVTCKRGRLINTSLTPDGFKIRYMGKIKSVTSFFAFLSLNSVKVRAEKINILEKRNFKHSIVLRYKLCKM